MLEPLVEMKGGGQKAARGLCHLKGELDHPLSFKECLLRL